MSSFSRWVVCCDRFPISLEISREIFYILSCRDAVIKSEAPTKKMVTDAPIQPPAL